MTKLEYVCTHLDLTKLNKEAREYLEAGTPLGEVIVHEYCPSHFGIATICVADHTSCTNCWNGEYRGA